MRSDTPLSSAVLQLSPKRTRCELFAFGDGKTEKITSALLKPFVTHLTVAEEQASQGLQAIKLEVDRQKNSGTWFTKGMLERFVYFIGTPEILGLVNKLDAEMSQLESARALYSQGEGHHISDSIGEGMAEISTKDTTKKELLRAIDVRLHAVKHDLSAARTRAMAAGYTVDSVSQLLLFADHFGARCLKDSGTQYIEVCRRRGDLINQEVGMVGRDIRSSADSDMSIDDLCESVSQDVQNSRHSADLPICSSLRRSSSTAEIVLNEVKENDRSIEKDVKIVTKPSSEDGEQPVRHLSVQDRINLFENKQREHSGGGERAFIRRSADFRRLSSDVGSVPLPSPVIAEKAVLRRWSGASDMSIDSNAEKDIDHVGRSTLSSLSNSEEASSRNSACKIENDCLSDVDDSSSSRPDGASAVRSENVVSKGQVDVQAKFRGLLRDHHSVDLKDHQCAAVPSQPKTISNLTANVGFKQQSCSVLGTLLSRSEQLSLEDQAVTEILPKDSSGKPDTLIFSNHVSSLAQASVFYHKASQAHISRKFHLEGRNGGGIQVSNVEKPGRCEMRYQFTSLNQHEGTAGTSKQVNSASLVSSQSTWEASPKRPYEGENDLVSSDAQHGNSMSIVFEDSDPVKMKLHRQSFVHTQTKKLQGNTDTATLILGDGWSVSSGSEVEGCKIYESSSASQARAQSMRLSKGNQELNEELQIKADELEKLFAAHKLRVSGEEAAVSLKGKVVNAPMCVIGAVDREPGETISVYLPETSSSESLGSSNTRADVDVNLKMENCDDNNTSKMKLSHDGLVEESRGILYDRYMRKREAKLKEEWVSKRAQKEVKMKALHDILERSRAELKAKLDAPGKDSVYCRSEKLRTVDACAALKSKEQVDDCFINEVEDQVSCFGNASLCERSSRAANPRRLSNNRSLSCTTSQASGLTVSHSSTKGSNAGSGVRHVQSEMPVARSVPNFANFRKENAKPSTGVSKTNFGTHSRKYDCCMSSDETASVPKVEIHQWSEIVEDSSAYSKELTSTCLSLNSNGIILTHSDPHKLHRNRDTEALIQHSSSLCPEAQFYLAAPKASMNSERSNSENVSQCLNQNKSSAGLVYMLNKNAPQDRDQVMAAGSQNSSKYENCEKSRQMCELNLGSEMGDMSQSPLEVDYSSPTMIDISSNFTAAETTQESPGGSPGSWMHHSFCYTHESSDVDAFIDFPAGSPSSWKSHSLNQGMEADPSRIRRKWGSAQKPFQVSNAASQQSRKDVTRGLKRLLKFGRKIRGQESLTSDWVSASMVSEGDDDTEESRDGGNQSSEDLRKLRTGSLLGPLVDSLNEGELLSDQASSVQSSVSVPSVNFKLRDIDHSGGSLKAPRSFFLLSSFRSKAGGEQKLR